MSFEYLKDISLLLVEDDNSARGELIKILKSYVKEAYEANDGEEGLLLYEKYKPDIVVTDIRMPNMDGLTLAEKIKERDKEAIIIITTAYSDDFNLMQSIEIGVNSFINKPIAPFKLLKNLNLFAKSISMDKKEKEKENIFQQNILLNAKSEILHDIAHHWRQPLSAISLQVDDIEGELEEESIDFKLIKKDLENMKEQIQKMSKSINSFSNLYAQDNEEKIRVKLINLINDSFEVLNYVLEDANIEFQIDIDGNFEIEVNERKFIQSIISIIKNSLEAKTNNSIEKAMITIKSFQDEKNLTLELIDNCGGIKEEIINKVFEPYFTTKFKSHGVGLSLFFVKNFFEKHLNSNIKIENFENGVKVTINIPF